VKAIIGGELGLITTAAGPHSFMHIWQYDSRFLVGPTLIEGKTTS
jgi:hypothetical protein